MLKKNNSLPHSSTTELQFWMRLYGVSRPTLERWHLHGAPLAQPMDLEAWLDDRDKGVKVGRKHRRPIRDLADPSADQSYSGIAGHHVVAYITCTLQGRDPKHVLANWIEEEAHDSQNLKNKTDK